MVAVNSALLLALAAGASAKPLVPPGHHAPPNIANLLSASKRGLHSLWARYYYGTEYGLTKPPPLPEKRDTSLPVGWSWFGCTTESYGQRLLQGFSFSSETLTTEMCLTHCSKMGFAFGGTEYGDECYCGSQFVGSGGQVVADSSCNMPCAGDNSETCGESWLLSAYVFNTSSLPGCNSEGSDPSGPISASPTTAPTGPTASSGATTTNGASPPMSDPASASPTMSDPVSASPSMSDLASASPTSTPIYQDTNDSSEWFVLGCAVDSYNRILTGPKEIQDQNLSVDKCLTWCEDQGYSFAGVEFGQECYCGHTVPTTITYNDGNCDMPCTGNPSETCGGGWGLELFELSKGSSACPTSSSSFQMGVVLPTNKTTAGGSPTASPSSKTTTKTTPQSSSTTKTQSSTTTKTQSSTARASTDLTSSTTGNAAPSTVSAQPTSVPSASNSHVVWAHFMVGNTYPYNQGNWANDISLAKAEGIDGFALNIGIDSWQPDRVHDAYAAAEAAGNFSLFLSLDMTSLGCNSWSDAQSLVGLVQQYHASSAQAMHDGKVLVSTFAGSDCTFGTGSSGGWQTSFTNVLESNGVDIFFVPSIFSDPSGFQSTSWLDGELNWNSGWPMQAPPVTTASDVEYMAALGPKEYMPAISPFFFTHFGANSWNKNWLYSGDDWLYATRWEQVIAMRDQVTMTEILTWNDYGESSYIGPIDGALPANSGDWVNGFDHTALSSLTKYYATAFKTGSYPAIAEDKIIIWQRPHPANAVASNDPAGQPAGTEYTQDFLWAVVMATAPGSVTLNAGSTSQTFQVSAGVSKLKIPSAPGGMGGSMARNGQTVATVTSSGFEYTLNPVLWNYNYAVFAS